MSYVPAVGEQLPDRGPGEATGGTAGEEQTVLGAQDDRQTTQVYQ